MGETPGIRVPSDDRGFPSFQLRPHQAQQSESPVDWRAVGDDLWFARYFPRSRSSTTGGLSVDLSEGEIESRVSAISPVWACSASTR